MINNWAEALGDANPLYAAEGLAPPAMIQVWTMGGLHGHRATDDPLGLILAALDDAGYTSIVATNCEQTYHRYLREGEQLTVHDAGSTTSSARSAPRSARAGSSPPATPGTSVTSRSPRCCSGC